MTDLTIDGRTVTVPEDTTILAACATLGVDIPTLCFLETLKPVNVCRLCVVEVEGARVLAPSCSLRPWTCPPLQACRNCWTSTAAVPSVSAPTP